MSIDRSPEKPYDFAPLPERCARAACAGHHRFAQGMDTGNLECDLVLLRPVQVAAGLLDFVRNDRDGGQLASLQATVARGAIACMCYRDLPSRAPCGAQRKRSPARASAS